MKNIITLILLIFAINGFAQTDNVKQTEQYLEFKAVLRGPYADKEGYNILVIMGERYLSNDSVIRKNIMEKLQSFSEKEDVLEFMNSMGWTLVSVYATSNKYSHDIYYVMKKEAKKY